MSRFCETKPINSYYVLRAAYCVKEKCETKPISGRGGNMSTPAVQPRYGSISGSYTLTRWIDTLLQQRWWPWFHTGYHQAVR